MSAIFWSGLLDLLYPPKCGVCGAMREPILCDACRKGMKPFPRAVCGRCGKPGDDCGRCGETVAPVRSAFLYEGVAGAAVRRLKYDRVYHLGEALGELLGRFARETGVFDRADCVVPVPIHSSRLRNRSFNQSELLAGPVAKALDIPCETGLLIRARRTPTQVGSRPEMREANVAGAFRAVGNARGKQVLLVDDVYTSGATLLECARVLREAGAAQAMALTVCREV